MQQYNCMIVEDEPLAVEILEDYIRLVPFLELKAVHNDALSAANALRTEKIDLIFLDIHLPRLKGLDFLSTLKNPPYVIITSAYHEYALKSYEYNVVDYLLKPIEFSRFLMAVNKLSDTTGKQVVQSLPGEKEYLFFTVNKKKVKVFLDDILYVEGQKEYVKIVTYSGSVTTRYQMGEAEELLTRPDFIRIHRSFIVAGNKIDVFGSTEVEIGGKKIPVGRSYREFLQQFMKGK